MSIDYVKVEQSLNRVTTAMSSVADKETMDHLRRAQYVMAEVRLASQCQENNVPIHEIQNRLLSTLLFDKREISIIKVNDAVDEGANIRLLALLKMLDIPAPGDKDNIHTFSFSLFGQIRQKISEMESKIKALEVDSAKKVNLPIMITFTGADDDTDIDEMYKLQREYPCVEFGILFSADRRGTPRYPSSEWLDRLCETNKVFKQAEWNSLNLAAHLCGNDAREVIYSGKYKLDDLLKKDFTRVQINTADKDIDLSIIKKWADLNSVSPILQCRGDFPQDRFVGWLFDCSGGRGLSPKSWPVQPEDIICGYAGGLNKDNIMQAINDIGKKAGHYWLDMETGVRDENDKFCLKTCREICEMVYGGKVSV